MGGEEVFSVQFSVFREEGELADANFGRGGWGGGWFLVGGGRMGGIGLNVVIRLMGNGGSFVVSSLNFGELRASSGGIS